MLEIKPLFSRDNLKVLLNEIKRLKNYSLTSFKEKILLIYIKRKKI